MTGNSPAFVSCSKCGRLFLVPRRQYRALVLEHGKGVKWVCKRCQGQEGPKETGAERT